MVEEMEEEEDLGEEDMEEMEEDMGEGEMEEDNDDDKSTIYYHRFDVEAR